MSEESAHQFVGSSSVRMDVMSQLSRASAETTALIDRLAVSESAVYNALSNLDDRGLVREGEEGWVLTGHGQLVADSIDQWQSVDKLVGTDPAYWEHHQTDVLPKEFRKRLGEIGEYHIARGEPPEVNRHIHVIATRMERVEDCRIVSPIYLPSHDDYMPNSPDTKILLTRGVIDTMLGQLERGERDQLDPVPEAEVRLAPVDFALNVSAEYLCLVLPNQDGIRETTATLVSETDAAVQWGEELFETLWAGSDPVVDYLRRVGFLDAE